MPRHLLPPHPPPRPALVRLPPPALDTQVGCAYRQLKVDTRMGVHMEQRVTLHWYERDQGEPYQMRHEVATGPQIFTTEPPVPNAYAPGPALRLDYDDWQALGAPIDIDVTITPTKENPRAVQP